MNPECRYCEGRLHPEVDLEEECEMHLATRQLSRAKEAVERLQAARKVGFLSFLSAPATSQYLEDQYRKAVDKAAEGLLAAEAFALLNMSMAQARFDKATVELRIARTKEAPAP